jgi:hypothetical protein
METLWLVAVMMGLSRFGGVMGEVRGKDENSGAIGKHGTTKLDCVRNQLTTKSALNTPFSRGEELWSVILWEWIESGTLSPLKVVIKYVGNAEI